MKTCNHLHDTGEHCNSAAAVNRDYCVFHLGNRARQHRMAQSRARSERFDLRLPPLESMSTVLSALNQLVEAIAADMIDHKRADLLLKSLRFAAQALKSSDKWQPSVYHTDVAAAAIDLATEYGLPQDLNLDTPPEVAFPPPAESTFFDLSSRAQAAASAAGVEGPAFSPANSPSETNDRKPTTGNFDFRADHPVTPEMIEVLEVAETQGADAAALRGDQLARNRQLRQLRTERKRFARVALQQNLRIAAEKLAQEKLAAQTAIPTPDDATRKPPAAASEDSAAEAFAARKEEAIA